MTNSKLDFNAFVQDINIHIRTKRSDVFKITLRIKLVNYFCTDIALSCISAYLCYFTIKRTSKWLLQVFLSLLAF